MEIPAGCLAAGCGCPDASCGIEVLRPASRRPARSTAEVTAVEALALGMGAGGSGGFEASYFFSSV